MLYEDNYLAHYGIKGQRWGVRRFQNEDGTLTLEGRRRYGYTDTGTGDSVREKASAVRKEFKKAIDEHTQKGFESEKIRISSHNPIKRIRAKIALYDAGKKVKDIAQRYSEITNTDEFTEEMRSARKVGSELGKNDVKNFDSMPDGPEKQKAATQFIKEMYESGKKMYDDYNGLILLSRHAAREYKMDPEMEEEESRMAERSSYLMNRIIKESVDWYEGKPKSEAAKNLYKDIRKNQTKQETVLDELRKKYENLPWSIQFSKIYKDPEYLKCIENGKELNNALCGVVLKDLGFLDTPDNRKYIYDQVFWD